MIIKIIIGIAFYLALLALMCVFFKGATRLDDNKDEEEMEALRQLREKKSKGNQV